MKTAVSVPDRVFAEAERLAKRLKKSRSQVYAEALAEYVARHDEDQVTERVNAALAKVALVAAIDRSLLQKRVGHLGRSLLERVFSGLDLALGR